MLDEINAGNGIYVIERDECKTPCEVSGYMFLAKVCGFVIATAFINDIDDVAETLQYHAEETASNYDTDLAVFHEEDCFPTREEALVAFAESGGMDDV
ncbi:MAG: hypothetical protein RR365_02100 [Bacteroides sp.]